jgi:Mg/Co/Ni transporter MgtE
MNINKTADAVEYLANNVHLFAAAGAVSKMQPWDAARVLDSLDIINAGGILAAMEPEKATRIMPHLPPLLSELIFADMGEPWEDAIRAAM